MTERTAPEPGTVAARATLILLTGITAGVLAAVVAFWAVFTDDMRATVWTIAAGLWVIAVAADLLYVAGCVGRLHRLGRQR